MRDIAVLRQIIRQESPSKIDLGTVISCDIRGTHNVAVRLSGGRVCTRTFTCLDDLNVGDEVVVVRTAGRDQVVVVAKVLSKYESSLSKRGILAPPTNLAVLPIPGAIKVSWDDYPGEDLCWQVRHNDSAADAGATDALVTGGSHYFYNVVDENTDTGDPVARYFRVRAIRWLSDNNVMYSAWSAWLNTTSVTFDGRYRTETELQSVANAEGASFIGIEDVGGYYDAVEVEAALQELGGAADFPAPGNLANIVVDDGTDWQSVAMAGDASVVAAGTLTVDGLQGRDVSAGAPADTQALVWNNGASQWEPQNQAGGGGNVQMPIAFSWGGY